MSKSKTPAGKAVAKIEADVLDRRGLEIAAPRPAPPLTVDAIRRAMEDSAALARMAKRWPVLAATPSGLVGKRGPAWGTTR